MLQKEERPLDLGDLRTFLEIAEAGGVSPAARRLGVSKSIVSRRLARVEQALGVQLLSRTTRGAVLTDAGATFGEHAARIAAELDSAQEAISPTGHLRGLLRIAAPMSFGPTLAPVFAELARRHPQLHVRAAYSDRFVDLVGEGFDAAVRLGFLTDSSLVARRICAIHGKYVASPSYIAAHGAPKTPDDLRSHEALMQGTEIWRFVNRGKPILRHPRGRFKADSGEALLAAALAGLGVAALPDFIIAPHVASGALTPVLTDYPLPDRGLYVVRPPGGLPQRKVRVLTDIVLEYFGAGLSQASAYSPGSTKITPADRDQSRRRAGAQDAGHGQSFATLANRTDGFGGKLELPVANGGEVVAQAGRQGPSLPAPPKRTKPAHPPRCEPAGTRSLAKARPPGFVIAAASDK